MCLEEERERERERENSVGCVKSKGVIPYGPYIYYWWKSSLRGKSSQNMYKLSILNSIQNKGEIQHIGDNNKESVSKRT